MAIKVRQEVNLIDNIYGSLNSGGVHTPPIAFVDPSMYSGTVTAYFEVVAKNLDVGAREIELYMDDQPNAQLNGSSEKALWINGSTTAWTRLRSTSFTLSTTNFYKYLYIQTSTGGDNNIQVKSARIIILQNCGTDDLYYTVSQFEIGNDELTTTETANQPLTYPKYWKYESAKWEGNELFYFHFSAEVEDDMYSGFYNLQEDNGSFSGWTNVFPSDFEVTSEDPIYVGYISDVYEFTPTDGRHYRVVIHAEDSKGDVMIYNAKIIATVSGVKDQEFLLEDNYQFIAGGSGSSGESAQAAGQSFKVTGTLISSIDVKAQRNNSPTDGLYVDIASTIDGAALATSETVAGSSLTTGPEYGWVKFVFSTPLTVTPNTTYYFRVFRTGARDTDNDYEIRKDHDGGYDNGQAYNRADNVWSSAEGDHTFRIFSTGLSKFQTEYLIANTQETSGTGLKNYDTYFDPAEWDDVDNVYTHVMEASQVASTSKLQEDPNGTPADIDDTIIYNEYPAGDKQSRGGKLLTIHTSTNSNTNILGGTAGSGEIEQAQAQSFEISTDTVIRDITIALAKSGSPTDNLNVDIVTSLGGSALSSGSIGGDDLSTISRICRVVMDKPVSIVGSTTYYIQLTRSGSRDGSNYFKVYGMNADEYSDGARYEKNNNSWALDASAPYDLAITVCGETKDMPATAKEIDVYVVAL
jgi:hypothetical protein